MHDIWNLLNDTAASYGLGLTVPANAEAAELRRNKQDLAKFFITVSWIQLSDFVIVNVGQET